MYNRYKSPTTNLSSMALDSLTRRILKSNRHATLADIRRKQKEDENMKRKAVEDAIKLRLKSISLGESLYLSIYDNSNLVTESKSERKPIGVTTTDNYVIVEFKNPPEKDIKKWRTKEIYSKKHKARILLKVAILKNGDTKVTSIWYPKDIPRAKEILRLYKENRLEDIYNEEAYPTQPVVTATKRPPIVKKVVPAELEDNVLIRLRKDPRSLLVPRRGEAFSFWRRYKGAF